MEFHCKWIDTELFASARFGDYSSIATPHYKRYLTDDNACPHKLLGVIKLRGDTTRSHLEKSVAKIYYFFLVVNVFFVYSLSGSFFSIINQILSTVSDYCSGIEISYWFVEHAGRDSVYSTIVAVTVFDICKLPCSVSFTLINILSQRSAVAKKWRRQSPLER